jgi:hypothetical protein
MNIKKGTIFWVCIFILTLIAIIVTLFVKCLNKSSECERTDKTSEDEKKRLSEPSVPELIFNTDELMGFFSQ